MKPPKSLKPWPLILLYQTDVLTTSSANTHLSTYHRLCACINLYWHQWIFGLPLSHNFSRNYTHFHIIIASAKVEKCKEYKQCFNMQSLSPYNRLLKLDEFWTWTLSKIICGFHFTHKTIYPLTNQQKLKLPVPQRSLQYLIDVHCTYAAIENWLSLKLEHFLRQFSCSCTLT